MKEEQSTIDTRNILTVLDGACTIRDVARQSDIEKAVQQQIQTDITRLRSIYDEQNKLRPKVLQFRDLENEAQAKQDRLRRSSALFGPDRLESEKEYKARGKSLDTAISMPVDEWRKNLPLWEAIVTVLEHVPEMQIVELYQVLQEFDFKSSRQAIESALVTHKERFVTRTRGREKFVSLKGA